MGFGGGIAVWGREGGVDNLVAAKGNCQTGFYRNIESNIRK